MSLFGCDEAGEERQKNESFLQQVLTFENERETINTVCIDTKM